MKELTLDEIPNGSDSATVIRWLVEEGDHVEEGDPLVKLSVDVKRFNYISPFTGVMDEIHYDVGEEVGLHSVLAILDEDEEQKESPEEPEEIL